jgi:hypothetical protein
MSTQARDAQMSNFDSSRGNNRRREMKKSLMMTTAAAALVACTGFAIAQNAGTEEHPGGAHPQAVAPHPAAPGGAMGGAMGHAQPGAKPAPGGAAQMQPKETAPNRLNSAQEEPNRDRVSPGGTRKSDQRMDQDHSGPERNGTNERGREPDQNAASPRDTTEGQNTSPERGTENNATGRSNDAQGSEHAARGNRPAGASVKLSQDQRTRIQTVIVHNSSARIEHPNFAVTVGTRVPSDVHIIVLPEEIVSIVPEYRGYDYVMVGDQILIIDPDSLEIVAVIPA